MLNLSYTITPNLRHQIEKIEKLRGTILLEQISPRIESQLRFETHIDRAQHAGELLGGKLNRADVVKVFEKNESIKAYQWIYYNWYLSPDRIGLQDFKTLCGILDRKSELNEKEARTMLDFIQVNPEHPIVQSVLALTLATGVFPENEKNLKLSIPLGVVFLYKYGFDFRGLLDIEGILLGDIKYFSELLKASQKEQNISKILEYLTEAILISGEKAYKKIKNHETKSDMPNSYYLLTERQKEILGLFEKPGVKISNKTIQKKFNVSQITSSRDLSKLYNLGLIFSSGKGRSITYTKI